MTDLKIKSVMPAQVQGAGWAVRCRLADGQQDRYLCVDGDAITSYTLAQAQAAARNNGRLEDFDIPRHQPVIVRNRSVNQYHPRTACR